MKISDVRIVADSACDLFSLPEAAFCSVPLKIITAEQEYVDDAALDVPAMARHLQHYKGRSSTSCPNTAEWLEAFGDAQHIFCATITGTLSGSYNAARTAAELYTEQHPDRKVWVFNSLSAGPEIALLLQRLPQLIAQGLSFEQVCAAAEAYSQKTGLLFMLQSMQNLANNGRVNPLVAKVAGLLGIRAVGKASDKGDLQLLNKCRGEEKALQALAGHLKELGYAGGKVNIAHCLNQDAAQKLADLLYRTFPDAAIEIYPCGGLCSFYAENGGLLIGFEKE